MSATAQEFQSVKLFDSITEMDFSATFDMIFSKRILEFLLYEDKKFLPTNTSIKMNVFFFEGLTISPLPNNVINKLALNSQLYTFRKGSIRKKTSLRSD